MFIVASFIHYAIFIYTLLIATRIIASLFPKVAYHPLILLIGSVTDPYLGVFRRLIPPIGGRLDLSPMLAFLGLSVLEKILTVLIFH